MAYNSLREFRRLKRIARASKYIKAPQRIITWNILKGDFVQLLSGYDKGKQGKVLAVDREYNQIFVEGLNLEVTDNDALQTDAEFTGRVEKEEPLHYSNVALVDPVDKKPCRIRHMFTDDGSKVRVSRRSGSIIPYPVQEMNYYDEVKPDGDSNTKGKAVAKTTFVPSLTFFEEEIEEMYSQEQLTKSFKQLRLPLTGEPLPFAPKETAV